MNEGSTVFIQYQPDFKCSSGSLETTTLQNSNNKQCNHTTTNHCKTPTGLECSNFNFTTDIFDSTLVTDLNLVCDKSIQITHSTSIFYLGGGLGSVCSGFFGDKYGRKYVAKISGLFLLIFTGLCCFSTGFSTNSGVFETGILGICLYSGSRFIG